jgi:hypothetical protein
VEVREDRIREHENRIKEFIHLQQQRKLKLERKIERTDPEMCGTTRNDQ